MEKYILGITISIRHHKKGMTTTEVNYFVGNFFVKVHGLKKNMIFK